MTDDPQGRRRRPGFPAGRRQLCRRRFHAQARRAWLILAEGALATRRAKTAHGVIRYSSDRIAAVVDPEYAGQSLAEAFPNLRRDAPIVSSIRDGLAYRPTTLLLGVAIPGTRLPASLVASVREAIAARLDVVNGMHLRLRDDPELVSLADEHGVQLCDVRAPPERIPLFSGRVLEVPFPIVQTVGTGSSVGKMTTALELAAAARRSGARASFVATGQTGIVISGRGMALDAVVSDFLPGAAEQLVCAVDSSCDLAIVEGQGSLLDPRYAAVTLGLLHGAAPSVLVLCHRIEDGNQPEALTRTIGLYEQLAAVVRPASVACISVNPSVTATDEAERMMIELEHHTGIPVGDVLNGDGARLWQAIADATTTK